MYWFQSVSELFQKKHEEEKRYHPPRSPTTSSCCSTPTFKEQPPTFGSSFQKVTIESVQQNNSTTDQKEERPNNCWLIFTCLTSRAIHLEHCERVDSLEVLDAINRFIKLYEVPEEVIFYGKHSYQEEPDNSRIRLGQVLQQVHAIHKFKLVMNPSSPLWGGFYPMMFHALSFALRTFNCTEQPIDSCKQKLIELINSRPILKHGNEWEVITPEHLVTGTPFGTFPQVALDNCSELIQFWKKFSLNYLNWLKEYHKMNAYIASAGELVLLWNSHQHQGLNKGAFNLAVIEEIKREGEKSESDKKKALIRLQTGEALEQEMKNLVPLECSRNDELLAACTAVWLPLSDYLDEEDLM